MLTSVKIQCLYKIYRQKTKTTVLLPIWRFGLKNRKPDRPVKDDRLSYLKESLPFGNARTPPWTSVNVHDVIFGFGDRPAVFGGVHVVFTETASSGRKNTSVNQPGRSFRKDSSLRDINIFVRTGNGNAETQLRTFGRTLSDNAPS